MDRQGGRRRDWFVSSVLVLASSAAGFGALLGWGVTAVGGEPLVVGTAAEEPRLYLPAVLHGTDKGPNEFELAIVPERITNSVPGQRCVYLVTLDEGDDGPAGPVALTTRSDAGEIAVLPAAISAGEVAEVVLVPDAASQEQTIAFEVGGVRGSITDTVTSTLDVLLDMPGIDEERRADAAVVRDRFVPWLAENHPELGIDEDTVWEGTIATPQILVVMHYLFFSEEWEMHVAWHIMIPPHDWRRIDLRHRADETVPSRAFEISSWGNNTVPIEIDPPEAIWR